MKKDPDIFIQHIIECLTIIEKTAKNKSWQKFFHDTDSQDIIIRRLEIIGEATKNLEGSFRKKYPEIPWKKMAALRNLLIHEYFGVDLKLVWNVVKKDIPELKRQISKIQ